MTLDQAKKHASAEAIARAIGYRFNEMFGKSEASRLMDIASKAQQEGARDQS